MTVFHGHWQDANAAQPLLNRNDSLRFIRSVGKHLWFHSVAQAQKALSQVAFVMRSGHNSVIVGTNLTREELA